MDSLQLFCDTYARLDRHNLYLLRQLYSEDVRFRDPAHEIEGIDNLIAYFARLYAGAESVRFTILHHLSRKDEAYVSWEMRFRHARLAGGSTIPLSGVSHLRFSATGKIKEHRDYFDIGAMLYEHLPLLGKLIKTIKRRLGQ